MDTLEEILLTALAEDNLRMELNAPRNLGCPRPRSIIKIDDLPVDCLEPILGNIPMQELLSKYRGVCSRWRGLIEDMCRRKVKSLMLYYLHIYGDENLDIHRIKRHFFNRINLDGLVKIDFSDIKSSYLFLNFLRRLFPNTTTLLLDYPALKRNFSAKSSPFTSQYLSELLSDWSRHLETLSIKLNIGTSTELDHLLPFINSCTVLRQLHLDCTDREYYLIPTMISFVSTLTVLEQLEHFSFKTRRLVGNLTYLPSLLSRCTRLSIPFSQFNVYYETLQHWGAASSDWTGNITHLEIFNLASRFQRNIFDVIAEYFISLEVLHVDFWPLSLMTDQFEQITQFASLRKLNELYLGGSFFRSILFASPPPTFRALVGVRYLRLGLWVTYSNRKEMKTGDNNRRFFTNLAAYFPNLERLAISSGANYPLGDFEPFRPMFPRLRHYETAAGDALYVDYDFYDDDFYDDPNDL